MKTFFTRYGVWMKLVFSVLVMLLCILVPFVIAMNTRSNGLGAGMYAISIFFLTPFSALINGILASTDLRRLWFLPAVPAAFSLALWAYPTGTSLSFQLTPVLALAVGYAAMTLCVFLLKRKKNKKS